MIIYINIYEKKNRHKKTRSDANQIIQKKLNKSTKNSPTKKKRKKIHIIYKLKTLEGIYT